MSKIETYLAHLNAIDKVEATNTKNDITLYYGDWNLPSVKWHESDNGLDYIPSFGESQCARMNIARQITSHLMNTGLFQICNYQNNKGNVLDLCYTNMPELSVVERADITLISDDIADKAHTQLSLTIECEPSTHNNPAQSSAYCFKKANYEEINNQLERISSNHTFLLHENKVNEMVDSLYKVLHKIIDVYVPRATIRINNKPIWYDKKLTTLKNHRNKEYKKLCRERIKNASADDSNFLKAKREFDEYQTIKYRDHIQTIASNVKNDQKKFWKYINGKRSGSKLPNKMTFDGKTAISDADKANLFAKFFSSVYVKHTDDINLDEFINNRYDSGRFNIIISFESVLEVLKTMDMNKGISPDKISPIFLRKCAHLLAGPL